MLSASNCAFLWQFKRNEKSAQRRRKHCALTVRRSPKNFAPLQTPSRGAGRPKFNQLEMVTTFIYRPSLVRIDARNFELSWKQTHPQTGPITLHCTAASAQCNEAKLLYCKIKIYCNCATWPMQCGLVQWVCQSDVNAENCSISLVRCIDFLCRF